MSDAALIRPATDKVGRLTSIDALRGFDMIWIVGAEGMVHSLRKASDTGVPAFLSAQLNHAAWVGFTFYDLIFPLFIFIVGISIVLSLGRMRAESGTDGVYRRIFKRGLLLYVVGIISCGGLSAGWDGIRWLGVLQRIAICYTVAATLFCLLRLRGLVVTGVALLLGYWALLSFVPVRDISVEKHNLAALQAGGVDARSLFYETDRWVKGRFEPGLNLTNHIDFKYLPGLKYDVSYDPEGLLSTLPAIATCLIGVFMGILLRQTDLTSQQKLKRMVVGGVALGGLGLLWSLHFPIIKQIWSSSFVLYAGGWSCLLLAVFYWAIELRNQRRWITPLLWIGTNPIALYLVDRFVSFDAIAKCLVGGPIEGALGAYGGLLVTAVSMALMLVLARFLYQRRIFLRL